MRKSLALVGSLAVAGAALLGATSAQADGFERAKGKGYYEPVPYHTWGGLYFGASIGGQWTDVTGVYTPPSGAAGAHHDSSPHSGIYGGHVGFQHQIGVIVVGIEAAVSGTGVFHDWSGGSNSVSGACLGAPVNLADRTCMSHSDFFFTIGPRVGWAINPSWLIYGTGGYASANLKTRTTVTSTGVETSFSTERHDGWFIGAGVEWAITPSWILGVEYQHLDFGSEQHLPTPVVGINDRRMDFETDIVRARLSYKIGRPVPVHDALK